MEENKLLKIDLNRCNSTPQGSLLFVDVTQSISNHEQEELLLTNNPEKVTPAESTSSLCSDKGQENNQRKNPLPSDTLMNSASRLRSFFFDDNTFKINSEEYLKNKILGIWHSMRYGWASNMRTNFSKETPICVLGKAYHRSFAMDNHECSDIEGFKRDFRSILWFTYRQKFSVLEGTSLTSDCGWGCMIRSGQMMIASALRRHILPRGWNYSSNNTIADIEKHKRLISWFSDFENPSCPFSIHNLVKLGQKLNKQAGNWYGPSCICHIFKDAFKEYGTSIPDLKNISVIVAQDSGVYLQDIITECSSDCCVCPTDIGCDVLTKEGTSDELRNSPTLRPGAVANRHIEEDLHNNSVTDTLHSGSTNGRTCVEQETANVGCDHIKTRTFSELCATNNGPNECPVCEHWKPSIILVPMRLGRSSVNSLYYQCVFSLLLHDLCIGIIGGRPSHSLYFIGFQDEYLIHIDPHLIQDTVSLDEKTFDFSSFHCSLPRKISISKMDPSSAVGFFCATKSDFIRLVKEVPQLISAKEGNFDSSLFEFIDSKSPLQQLELEDFECEVVDLSKLPSSPIGDEELVC